MYKHAIFLFLSVTAIRSPATASNPTCHATPLSRAEARVVVESTHDAIMAKEQGATIEAVEWNPGLPYRNDIFYYFILQVRAGTAKTLLDNGLIGYYAVNLRSGRVINTASEEQEGGEELERVQRTIRRKHCIGVDVIAQNEKLQPEG